MQLVERWRIKHVFITDMHVLTIILGRRQSNAVPSKDTNLKTSRSKREKHIYQRVTHVTLSMFYCQAIIDNGLEKKVLNLPGLLRYI